MLFLVVSSCPSPSPRYPGKTFPFVSHPNGKIANPTKNAADVIATGTPIVW